MTRPVSPDRAKKQQTRKTTMRLINLGLVTRQSQCWLCENTQKVECHHIDYDSPIRLAWLCMWCHAKEHQTGFATRFAQLVHQIDFG